MEHIEQQPPLGCPNNLVVSSLNGACQRHLARPEVLVQVRARRLREHEVVRDVVGAHPLRGPIIYDVQGPGVQGQLCNFHYTRQTATGQDTLAVPFSLVFFLISQVDGWPLPRPAGNIRHLLCLPGL